VFIKWLTASEQNMDFVANTGYLPVTRQAFEEDINTHMDTVEDLNIKKMLTSVLSMYEAYTFFTAPNYSSFDNDSDTYEKSFKKLLTDKRNEYLEGIITSAEDALSEFRR